MTDVVVALGSVTWEAQLLSALSHPMLGMQIQRRCVDGVDIRSAIRVVAAEFVLVSDETLRVDDDCVNDVHAQGIRFIALTQRPEQWLSMGVSDVIHIDESNPLACVQVLVHMLRNSEEEHETTTASLGHGVAVVGFGGGAGRSTTARELAFAVSQVFTDSRVLLADADTYGPSLAQELGDEDLSQGLLAVCRAHENRSLDSSTFRDHVTPVTSNLDLLAGISRSSRWTDLRIPALRATWNTALESYNAMVSDLGPVIEVDASAAVDSTLPRRHAAMLTALDVASTVVLSTRADAIGVTRLIRGVIDTESVLGDKNIHVVVSGVHNSRQARELEQSIIRFAGLSCIHTVPFVPDVMSKALEHNTFASLLDKSVAQVFENLAKEIGIGKFENHNERISETTNTTTITSLKNAKRTRLKRVA